MWRPEDRAPGFYSLELIKPDFSNKLQKQAREMHCDTSWMRKAKYGLQFHWTSLSAPRRGDRKLYAQACRDFPAKEFAGFTLRDEVFTAGRFN